MELVHKAERTLEGIFKGFPNLSNETRTTIAKVTPWLALIGGVLQIAAAYWLWRTIDATESLLHNFGMYGYLHSGLGTVDRFFIYLGVIALFVYGLILLLAYTPLRAYQKKGWDFLLLGILINLVYGLIALFIDDRGFGELLGRVLGSGLALWLLFQIRDHYTRKHAAGVATKSPSPKSHKKS